MLGHAALLRLCHARDRLREGTGSVREIAADAGLSPFQFIRAFAAVFGETPHQHRIAARLEQARHLLARGEHSVTDVCAEVGFESLGSFSALFARRVGVSPNAYRRRVFAVPQRRGRLPHDLVPGCLLLMGGAVGLALAISEKQRARRSG